MTHDLETLLGEARECAQRDPERAMELFRRIAGSPRGPAWSEAQVELAIRALMGWEIAEVFTRTQAVLSSDTGETTAWARRAAAVTLNQARNARDEQPNMEELRGARDECEAAGDDYLAADASFLLALQHMRSGERARARREFERSEAAYERAGSMLGAPKCEHNLAKMLLEEGDVDAARDRIARGLAMLERYPYGGVNVRSLKSKLKDLDVQIAAGIASKR